jgi:hypothetical protein
MKTKHRISVVKESFVEFYSKEQYDQRWYSQKQSLGSSIPDVSKDDIFILVCSSRSKLSRCINLLSRRQEYLLNYNHKCNKISIQTLCITVQIYALNVLNLYELKPNLMYCTSTRMVEQCWHCATGLAFLPLIVYKYQKCPVRNPGGTLLPKPQSPPEYLFWKGKKHKLYLTCWGWRARPAREAGSASCGP